MTPAEHRVKDPAEKHSEAPDAFDVWSRFIFELFLVVFVGSIALVIVREVLKLWGIL